MHSLAFRSGLGDGIYGGWWVGVQAGWWGTTTVTTAGTAAGSPAGQRAIMWLEENTARVQHIMAQKHAWDHIVTLTGNVAQDYRAVQPYIQQTINSGMSTQIGVTSQGPLMQFVTTINGQQIVVIAIQVSENVYKISNAWVQTR